MQTLSRLILGVAVIAASLSSSIASADWQLDSEASSLNFVSVKNAAIAEVHQFRDLSGDIDEGGSGRIRIALDSLETLIDIRNERMRELLFETAQFPDAIITLELDAAALEDARSAEPVQLEVPLALSLHGVSRTITVAVNVLAKDEQLYVVSAQPVIINAADFGLAAGVAKLQQLAGLSSISTAIPVTFSLLFSQSP